MNSVTSYQDFIRAKQQTCKPTGFDALWMPVEAERLQGFPDNWTRIPWRNKPADKCPDGPRYKAIGNSFAVPVVRWIGSQIADVVGWQMDEAAESCQ